jgi:hypothetical protein
VPGAEHALVERAAEAEVDAVDDELAGRAVRLVDVVERLDDPRVPPRAVVGEDLVHVELGRRGDPREHPLRLPARRDLLAPRDDPGDVRAVAVAVGRGAARPERAAPRAVVLRLDRPRAVKCGWPLTIPVSSTAQRIPPPSAPYPRFAVVAWIVCPERSSSARLTPLRQIRAIPRTASPTAGRAAPPRAA